jgi:hypothetical protein
VKRLLVVLTTTAALFLAAPSGAHAAAAAPPASTCNPGTTPTAPATTEFFDPGQPAMGPAALPGAKPVGPLLPLYRRFGGLSEPQFIAKYRSGSSWVYPPDDGFLKVAGIVVRHRTALTPGKRIDRFGYPGGAYLSPVRTLFAQRALPPQNLSTPVGTPQANYHVYCVLRTFDVDGGPIAPWFGQPGLGVQYKLEAESFSVSWLIDHGYLVEERPV